MGFKVGDKVKIVSEGRSGVIKDCTRSHPVMYIVRKDALFKGEKGRYASVFEENLEHLDPVQYALNEGFNDYMQASGHDIMVNSPVSKTEEETIVMGLRSGKTYLTQIGKFTNKDNGFDSVIYEMEKQRKFAERGTDEMKNVEVEKIIFNGFKTIVFWNDGTKTIVSMSQEERNFDPEDAFRAAYTKKMYGTNSKIKRVIKEKSNIEQYQRIVEEKLKEERAKISQDYDKLMRELCPWLYTGGKDDECLGKLCPCGDLENAKAEMEDNDGNN